MRHHRGRTRRGRPRRGSRRSRSSSASSECRGCGGRVDGRPLVGHAVRDGHQGGKDEDEGGETSAGAAAVTPVAPRHRDLDLDLLDLLDLELGRFGLE